MHGLSAIPKKNRKRIQILGFSAAHLGQASLLAMLPTHYTLKIYVLS
ncbi:hypothetical protein [Emticicia sp.]